VESTATPSVTPEATPTPEVTPSAIEQILGTDTPEVKETATPSPTVSVSPVPVPTITANVKGYHNLTIGDKGDDVRKLQEKLIELGYLPEGAADGAYGRQTRNAVRYFQYYNSLTVDGVAGRATQTNLFENPDIVPMPTATPTAEPTGTPVPEASPEEETDEVTPVPEDTAEPTVTPIVVATASPEVTAPAATPVDATEEASAEKVEELAAPEETEKTEEAAEETTEAPAEETAEVTEASAEETAEATEGAETDEATPEPEADEVVENVDLDEEEATAEPEETEPAAQYEDLAGWIVLNDGGESMQWTATEDGVPVVRSPRMQRYEDDIRVSLDDLAQCADGWELTEEDGTVVLEAEGYTLAMVMEDTGLAAMVDGTEMVTDDADFDFGEGHFIRADFLTRALDGSYEWDEEEQTLMLRIPGKDAQSVTD